MADVCITSSACTTIPSNSTPGCTHQVKSWFDPFHFGAVLRALGSSCVSFEHQTPFKRSLGTQCVDTKTTCFRPCLTQTGPLRQLIKARYSSYVDDLAFVLHNLLPAPMDLLHLGTAIPSHTTAWRFLADQLISVERKKCWSHAREGYD